MKAFLCLPVAVLAVSLSGCASNSSMASNSMSSESKYDEAYIAKVDRISRDRGVVVKWVNPPRKKKPVDDDKSD